MSALLSLRQVWVEYGEKVVLERVSLDIEEGSFVSVVGPSGAGKSTFLRLILGQESPTRGTILLDGTPLTPECHPDRGVVFQRSQFSFVRGNAMPAIPKASRQWKNAVAIAQIAHAGSWDSPVEGALFFHAAYVSPGWHLTRLGRVDNHVFYR